MSIGYVISFVIGLYSYINFSVQEVIILTNGFLILLIVTTSYFLIFLIVKVYLLEGILDFFGLDIILKDYNINFPTVRDLD